MAREIDFYSQGYESLHEGLISYCARVYGE